MQLSSRYQASPCERRSAACMGAWSLLAMTLLNACASTAAQTVPSPTLSRSEAAIGAAFEVGAQAIPGAALHLQLAREQVAEAQRLIEQQETHRAEYLLMRAEADAELALALAREAPARALAQDAIDRVQALEDSLEALPEALADDELDLPPRPGPQNLARDTGEQTVPAQSP